MSKIKQSPIEATGTAAPKSCGAFLSESRHTVAVGDQYPSLESLTRPTVPTPQAAHYLNRRPQTLRSWACREDGALRPIRVNGRLAWRVSEIRQLLGA